MVISLLNAVMLVAQPIVVTDATAKRKKSLVVYIGGGPSYYTTPINNQPNGISANVSRLRSSFTARVMWHPQYRLRVGLESGVSRLYSYQLENGNSTDKVSLTAVPLLLTWSMPVYKRLQIFAGFGSYFLTTRLDHAGKVKSGTVSLGSNVAVSYLQPLSKNLQLSAEAKWMDAFVTKDYAFSVEMLLAWKFMEW